MSCNGKSKPPEMKKDTPAKGKITGTALKSKIEGIWAYIGEENATFVIEDSTIFYPDHGATYKYFLAGDSLKIKFDDYDGNYLVKMRGPDTLVTTGDEEHVYFRFKK